MARKLRVEYPGAIYHVMNRGNRREPIFRDDEDRKRFLLTLGEVCAKAGWQVHALCLRPNHFHLVVETPQPNLVAGMKWFLYTSREGVSSWY
jgi:REP element-mobilizing transposase RayT